MEWTAKRYVGVSLPWSGSFARRVQCRTRHFYIAVDARRAVSLGSEGVVFRDLSFEVPGPDRARGVGCGSGVAERAALVGGDECGFGVDR